MIRSLRQRIVGIMPKGQISRGIMTLAGGTAAAQIITVGAMPIVTRLYSPAQIGVISLFVAFFLFWSPALSLRYEYALLIAQDDAESHAVHRLAALCVGMTSLIALPALSGLIKYHILGFELLPWWAVLFALPILFGYGQFMVYRSWALRAGAVNSITKASIARSAANAGTRITLGFAGGGIIGLFIAELAGAWGPAAALYRSVRMHFAPSRPAVISSEMLRSTAKRYLKFPLFEMPSTLVNQLALTLPLPMIASLHGATAAGWFGLARAMVGIPNAQIGSAVADVFQVELARAVLDEDYHRARHLFYKLLTRLSLFGLAPLAGIILFAPWAVPFIFGNTWEKAGLAAAAIAPWLYASLVVSSLSRVLSVLQAQEYKLLYDAIALLLFVGVFLMARKTGMAFVPMIIALSSAGVISYLIYLIVLLVVVENRLRSK